MSSISIASPLPVVPRVDVKNADGKDILNSLSRTTLSVRLEDLESGVYHNVSSCQVCICLFLLSFLFFETVTF